MLRRPFIRPSQLSTLAGVAAVGLVAWSCASGAAKPYPPTTPEGAESSAASSAVPSPLPVDPSFSQAYNRLGGSTWLGPAISTAFVDRDLGWRLQIFEFGVLAEDPSSEAAFPLWVNNLLGRQTARALPSTDPDCKYVEATGHNVCSAFLSFYEAQGAAHLGPPVAESAQDPRGVLRQDFEYGSLEIVDGSPRLAAIGRSFFAARGYSALLLEPEGDATPASAQGATEGPPAQPPAGPSSAAATPLPQRQPSSCGVPAVLPGPRPAHVPQRVHGEAALPSRVLERRGDGLARNASLSTLSGPRPGMADPGFRVRRAGTGTG